MLTVKHIKWSGCENIHLAREVRYDCGRGATSIADAPTLWIDTPSGDTEGLGSEGTFFVMNEAGKTIARYNLGGYAGVAAVPDDGRLAEANPLRRGDSGEAKVAGHI